MKTLLIILAALFLASCARVTVQTENTPSGTDWDITYSTFFRSIEDVEAGVGSAKFSLGKAGVDSNTQLACLLAPHLCQ
jgi:hypothetical protein